MSMLGLEVSVQTDVQSKLAAMVDRIKKPRPALAMIGKLAAMGMEENIKAGGEIDRVTKTATWPPTVDGGKPLFRTGRLAKSISWYVTDDSRDVKIGTRAFFARVHQDGMTIHAKKGKYLKFQIGDRWVQKESVTIPARPFIVLTTRTLTYAVPVLINYIITGYINHAPERGGNFDDYRSGARRPIRMAPKANTGLRIPYLGPPGSRKKGQGV